MTPFVFTTSTVADGNMSLRFTPAERVIDRRTCFLAKHGAHWNDHICMRCDHGQEIIAVDMRTPTDTYRMIDAEVLITQTPGLALMLLTADCIPALFFDPTTHSIALAHFSRQTIATELPLKTMRFMKEHFASEPADILVTTGPFIHTESYTFSLPQPALPEHIAPYTKKTDTTISIDLAAALHAQLRAAGVATQHIHFSPMDTAIDPEYFSHYQSSREEVAEGRIATIAMLSA